MSVFVGSGTNIKSDRIGFAVSTTNPGTVEEGDTYFNQTSNALNVYDGSAWNAVGGGAGGNFEAVASGTLSDGQTVIIQSDGNVASVSTENPTNTTQQQFDSDKCYSTSAIYIGSGKVLISYKDSGNSYYGTSIVASISGSTITYGTPVVFEASYVDEISSTYDSGNSKFVIVYKLSGSNSKSIVGSVSGTTITFGTAQTLSSSIVSKPSISYTGSSTGKLITSYAGSGSGYYRVGTMSGTSITWQSEQAIASGISEATCTFDTATDRVAFFYNQPSTTYQLKLKIGTLSGTNITLGSEISVDNSNCQSISATTTSASGSSPSILVCSYYVNGVGTFISAAQLTSGSGNTISGSIATSSWYSTNRNDPIASLDTSDGSIEKFVLSADRSSYNEATIAAGGSGPTITTNTQITLSFASPVNSYFADRSTSVWVPTVNKLLYAFMDDLNGGSYASLVTPYSTNLTSSNFAGFSDGAYTNGQTAKVQIAGSVDDAQVGLTTGQKYFVQTDGTLSTSAGNPSVEAGTAVSASKIIIKG